MIICKKAKKKDLPLLIEYKLLTITPYLKSNQEKLKAISEVNAFLNANYEKYLIIHYFFKKIGAYLIINHELDTFYIDPKYQHKGIESKILNKENKNIKSIKLAKENLEAIQFYKQKGFNNIITNQDYIILKKGDIK